MKKIIAIVAVVATFTACHNKSETETPVTVITEADTTAPVEVVDTTVVVDSIHE